MCIIEMSFVFQVCSDCHFMRISSDPVMNVQGVPFKTQPELHQHVNVCRLRQYYNEPDLLFISIYLPELT
jgi:hypothetical protein